MAEFLPDLGPGVNTAGHEETGPALLEDEVTGILTLYLNALCARTGCDDEDIYVTAADPGEPFGDAQTSISILS